MAVYSMTGYCSESASHESFSLTVELRSVNSRFLDLTFRMPDELRSQEPLIREAITQHIKRGKIEVRVGLERRHANRFTSPEVASLQALQSVEAQIQSVLPQAKSLSVYDVLRLFQSDVQQGHSEPDPELVSTLHTLLPRAIALLRSARQTEGARLKDALLERIALLRTLAAQAAPLVPELVAQQQLKFLERWNAALDLVLHTNTTHGLEASPALASPKTDGLSLQSAQDRALSEAASFALRLDVAEELDRLCIHLDEIEALLHKGGELGKRLDFMIQELHREANTLGSKSALAALSKIAIDMKVLIEQMREQVQNIE